MFNFNFTEDPQISPEAMHVSLGRVRDRDGSYQLDMHFDDVSKEGNVLCQHEQQIDRTRFSLLHDLLAR